MLYGRNGSRHLAARLEKLATTPQPPPVAYGTIAFRTGHAIDDFSPDSSGGDADEIEPIVTRKDLRVEVRWRTPIDFRPVFAEGYFVRIEEGVNGHWQPVRLHGRDFDDVSQDIQIVRRADLFGWIAGEAAWTVELALPRAPTADGPLRIRVAPRGGFPGFTALI
jgi:hypothetical protein